MSDKFPFNHFLDNTDSKPNIIPTPPQEIETAMTVEGSWNEAEIKLINEDLHEKIKEQIGKEKYTIFFAEKLQLKTITQNRAIFEGATNLSKKIIEEQYLNLISNLVQDIIGKQYSIQINTLETKKNTNPSFTLELSPTADDLNSAVESKYLDHLNQDESGQAIDPNKTFDNFIVGPSNNLAFATTHAVADSPGKTGRYPCLYLYSNSGLGKTHLLHSVANGIKGQYPNLVICLISAREFMKEFINAIKDKKLTEFQKKYSDTVDILMIDDIHELKNKQSTQEEFFHIFNELHSKGKQLIFTSDKPPKQITGIEERIITRLQWGLVIDIQKPDLETRIAILKRKALELDLFLPDEVLGQIASNIRTSIRELEGSLIKLKAAADVMNIEIDAEMVKDMLKIMPEDSELKATLDSIAKTVSTYYKISLGDLKSKSRHKENVRARHIAWYLSKKVLDSTLKEIAYHYAGRDHSSVIHGISKITEQLKDDMKLSRDISYLESTI